MVRSVRELSAAASWRTRLRRVDALVPTTPGRPAAPPTYRDPTADCSAAVRDLATIDQANAFLEGRFRLLGYDYWFPEDLPWRWDCRVGYRYDALPKTLLTRRMRFAPAYDRGVECKMPWELGRCQHFPVLAQAFAATRDEQYLRKMLAQAHDFMAQNPPGIGIQWVSTMDVAIRAANWVWAFARAGLLEHGPSPWIEESLRIHGEYIRANREVQGVIGNHYLADVAGLAFVGWALRDTRDDPGWWHEALHELHREVLHQFHSDGADFEASIPYHRLSTELALYPLIAAIADGEEVPQAVLDRLQKAIEFVAHYTLPDGEAPVIGDADDGRFLALTTQTREHLNRHGYLVSIGAVVFHRSDFARIAGVCHPEAVALLGPSAEREFATLLTAAAGPSGCNLESRSFAEGGLYIMRHQDLHMTVRAGDVGQDGAGGHAHNDSLGITLSALGMPWIVDSGLACYTSDFDGRNRSRSTSAHNTISIDDLEARPFARDEIFRLVDSAPVHVEHWHSSPDSDEFVGRHTGYSRPGAHIAHRRRIRFEKANRRWSIEDEVLGSGIHLLRFVLHCMADQVTLEESGDSSFAVRLGRGREGRVDIVIRIEGSAIDSCTHAVYPEDVYVSYENAAPAWTIDIAALVRLPLAVLWVIVPRD